jgi:nucleotide-binding universal stress UspA family protein
MKRFKQILHYTDAGERSRPALARAAGLTLLNRGRLTVLGVV